MELLKIHFLLIMNKNCNGLAKRIGNIKLPLMLQNLKQYKRIELVFEGLDTYADVYLNDSLILKAENMFREWILM